MEKINTDQPIVSRSMSWDERQKLTRLITGGKWINNKTNKIVEVIERQGYDLILKHESGRITKKQDHYFVGDYSTYFG